MNSNDAPDFAITIENNDVTDGVRQCIQQIEYENAESIPDLIKIQLGEPTDGQGRLMLHNSKLFMPGNEISVFMGYGSRLVHAGRAIIRRMTPNFPASGTPGIEVVAYSADSMMADTGPEALKDVKKLKRKPGIRIKNAKAGRRWKDAKYSDAVIDRARAYGFEADVDETLEPPSDFIQKARMTDYDFIKGLSNLTGYLFWVDSNSKGEWTLHFRNPSKLKQSDFQSKTYTFKYNDGDYSSLLSFEPEVAIQGAITKLLVQAWDPVRGELIEVKIEEENDESPETKVDTGNVHYNSDNMPGRKKTNPVSPNKNQIKKGLSTGSDIKIYLEDYSFDLKTDIQFKSAADLSAWAAAWFRRNRENFLLSRGTTIGLEYLRARQIHNLKGLGAGFDGQYLFTKVRHIMSTGAGYHCEFNARRIIKELPPVLPDTIRPDIIEMTKEATPKQNGRGK